MTISTSSPTRTRQPLEHELPHDDDGHRCTLTQENQGPRKGALEQRHLGLFKLGCPVLIYSNRARGWVEGEVMALLPCESRVEVEYVVDGDVSRKVQHGFSENIWAIPITSSGCSDVAACMISQNFSMVENGLEEHQVMAESDPQGLGDWPHAPAPLAWPPRPSQHPSLLQPHLQRKSTQCIEATKNAQGGPSTNQVTKDLLMTATDPRLQYDVNRLRSFFRDAEMKCADLSGNIIAMLLRAVATAHHPSRMECAIKLCDEFRGKATTCNATAVADALWALSDLNVPRPGVLLTLRRRILLFPEILETGRISELLLSVVKNSKLKVSVEPEPDHTYEDVIKALCRQAALKAEDFQASQLCKLFVALAQLDSPESALLEKLGSVVTAKRLQFRTWQIVDTIHAIAQMNVSLPDAVKALKDVAQRRSFGFTSVIVKMLEALELMKAAIPTEPRLPGVPPPRVRDPELVVHLCSEAQAQLNDFNINEIERASWALDQLSHYPGKRAGNRKAFAKVFHRDLNEKGEQHERQTFDGLLSNFICHNVLFNPL